jgi:serine phosphatase RsbU (regulator of sigma subunit)
VYLVKNDRTVQELNAGGVALGMLDMDFPYESEFSVIEIQSLIADIRRFAGAAPQVDDITALYLRRL